MRCARLLRQRVRCVLQLESKGERQLRERRATSSKGNVVRNDYFVRMEVPGGGRALESVAGLVGVYILWRGSRGDSDS